MTGSENRKLNGWAAMLTAGLQLCEPFNALPWVRHKGSQPVAAIKSIQQGAIDLGENGTRLPVASFELDNVRLRVAGAGPDLDDPA